MISFPRVQYGKGVNESGFGVEMLDKYHLIQVTKVNISSNNS